MLLGDLFPELRLDLLVVVDGLAYPTVQSFHLCPVALARSIWLTLDTLDAIGQSTVSTHNVCAEAIDFLVRSAGAGNKVALQALQVVQTSLEVINRASDSAAVIENGVWIARLRCGRIWSSVASEGLHLDIVCLPWLVSVMSLAFRSKIMHCTYRMMEAARRSCHRDCHMDWTGHTRRCCSCCTVGKPCQLLVYHLPVPMLPLIQRIVGLSKLSPAHRNRTSGVGKDVDLQPLCWCLLLVLNPGGLSFEILSLSLFLVRLCSSSKLNAMCAIKTMQQNGKGG